MSKKTRNPRSILDASDFEVGLALLTAALMPPRPTTETMRVEYVIPGTVIIEETHGQKKEHRVTGSRDACTRNHVHLCFGQRTVCYDRGYEVTVKTR